MGQNFIIKQIILISLLHYCGLLTANENNKDAYIFDEITWLKPFADSNHTWGGNSGVHVESKDRIFFLQRGETKLPQPIPPSYTDFPASMGIPD